MVIRIIRNWLNNMWFPYCPSSLRLPASGLHASSHAFIHSLFIFLSFQVILIPVMIWMNRKVGNSMHDILSVFIHTDWPAAHSYQVMHSCHLCLSFYPFQVILLKVVIWMKRKKLKGPGRRPDAQSESGLLFSQGRREWVTASGVRPVSRFSTLT